MSVEFRSVSSRIRLRACVMFVEILSDSNLNLVAALTSSCQVASHFPHNAHGIPFEFPATCDLSPVEFLLHPDQSFSHLLKEYMRKTVEFLSKLPVSTSCLKLQL